MLTEARFLYFERTARVSPALPAAACLCARASARSLSASPPHPPSPRSAPLRTSPPPPVQCRALPRPAPTSASPVRPASRHPPPHDKLAQCMKSGSSRTGTSLASALTRRLRSSVRRTTSLTRRLGSPTTNTNTLYRTSSVKETSLPGELLSRENFSKLF